MFLSVWEGTHDEIALDLAKSASPDSLIFRVDGGGRIQPQENLIMIDFCMQL